MHGMPTAGNDNLTRVRHPAYERVSHEMPPRRFTLARDEQNGHAPPFHGGELRHGKAARFWMAFEQVAARVVRLDRVDSRAGGWRSIGTGSELRARRKRPHDRIDAIL